MTTTADSAPLALSYQLTPRDFAQALLFHMRGSRVYWYMFGLGVMFLCIVPYSVAVQGRPLSTQTLGLVFGIVFTAGFPLLAVATAGQSLRNQPTLAQPQTITLHADGIETEGPAHSGREAWTAYTGYRESRHVFLLYYSDRLFRCVPKRVFPTPALLDDFRTRIEAHLPRRGMRWMM